MPLTPPSYFYFPMNASLLRKTFAVAALCGATSVLTVSAQQLRPVGSFERIKTSGACDVQLTQGATTEVKVQAEGGAEQYIKTEVQNGALMIFRDPNAPRNVFNNKKAVVYVTCPRLTSIEASGACDVVSKSTFAAEAFTIKASGACDINLQLNATTLNVQASGASDIRLAGRVERQQVQISGSSDYQATNLKSHKANVQASGSSDAYVFVDGELSSHASGASDIHNASRTSK